MLPTAVANVPATARSLTRMIAGGAYEELRRPPVRRVPDSVPRTSFDPTLPGVIADPHPHLARLREERVHVNEKLNIWMLARYNDVTAAAGAHDELSSASGILMRAAPMQTVVTTDNPDHDRLRRAIAPAFTPAAIRRLEERLGEFVTPGLDALAAGDVVDMVQALTVPLPVSAIAVLLGVDRSRWQDFREWSNDVTTLFGVRTPADLTLVTGRALPNILALRNLIDGEMRTRTDESDDILALLRRARTERLMSPVEALSAAMLLLVAGNETTTNLLGSILIALAADPDLYTRLRDDRTLIPRAVEEGLRWGSPVQWVARTALAPYAVGDTVIPAKSRVVLFYAGANRDPARFNNPADFDIDRKALGHCGFGHGAHFCMGAHLARLEVKVALNALFDRFSRLEVAGPVRWTTTPSLSGPTGLPMRAAA
ncbi:MAG: cytochrome P450 [Mycobacterium sp.]